MSRAYTPVTLPLRPVPSDLAQERAVCPQCTGREHEAVVDGRIGLRLVFRCTRCGAHFYRTDRRAAAAAAAGWGRP